MKRDFFRGFFRGLFRTSVFTHLRVLRYDKYVQYVVQTLLTYLRCTVTSPVLQQLLRVQYSPRVFRGPDSGGWKKNHANLNLQKNVIKIATTRTLYHFIPPPAPRRGVQF